MTETPGGKPPIPNTGQKILVAADTVAEILTKCLADVGYDATILKNIGPASPLMETVTSGRYNLLILTNSVCAPAGIADCISEIKPSCPRMKILVMSGYITEAFAKAWRDAGADAIMQLPFTLEEVQNTVRDLLGPPCPGPHW